MSMHLRLIVSFAVVTAMTLLSGCQTNAPPPQADTAQQTSSQRATAPPAAGPANAQLASDRTGPQPVLATQVPVSNAPAQADGWVRGRLAYPTGDPATSALLLEKALPAEVTTGRPFEYEIKVTNISKLNLEGITVSDVIPNTLKLAEMQGMTMSEGTARIAFGALAPGESRSAKVNATASGTGGLMSCTSVDFNTSLCIGANIVQPAIKLAMSAPSEVMICDAIPVKVVVTNSGTGTARNIRLEAPLPAGMTTADGKNVFASDVGTLTSGQSKEVTFTTKVAKTGRYEAKATAKADNGLLADAAPIATVVRQPILAITETGPQRQYIGRPFTYEITVTNRGDAPARDTVLINPIPADAQFEAASDNVRPAAGKVQWSLGEIAPGASKKVTLTLNGTAPTAIRNQVTAQARCADNVTALATTELSGIAALLLECVDQADPIEVGQNGTYIVRVTNQGSANATNVRIVCNLEDTMTYVSSSGATRGASSGKVITFEPVATIPPKGKAEWQVVIKAVNAGDVRFKIDMTADQLTRPVEETESSNFYK